MEKENKKALIIAVSEYHNKALKGTDGKGLDFCKKDGIDMSRVLELQRYQISANKKLIGEVKFDIMRDTIYDFFDNPNIKSEDTLLFYYSGHGIPGSYEDTYLASSEIDPERPFMRGFSFDDLTKMMNITSSTKVVCILDCCYSGAAKLSKGSASASAKLGNKAIKNKSESLQQGKVKCLLAASQASQEAYANKKNGHSIFTYYLLAGLKKNKHSVDRNGYVTADTLATFVYNSITSLPANQKPKQVPIKKVEAGNDIILAKHPSLAERIHRAEPKLFIDREKYIDSMSKIYRKSGNYGEVFNLAGYWCSKFETNIALSLSDIKSFENEFILGKMFVWLSTLNNSEYWFLKTLSKIINNDLIPQIDTLKKLHNDTYGKSIGQDRKERIIKMQRRIAKTIGEILRYSPP